MGKHHSKSTELSSSLKEKVDSTFRMFDENGSETIDKEEAIKHWGRSFSKMNTEALFSAVDKNGDGSITLDEWHSFWIEVKAAGHCEEEIEYELDDLLDGGSWTAFKDVKFGKKDIKW